MHLIIDIRTKNRNPFPIIRYAESWANYWIQTHPKDTCSFLVFKGQIAPKKFPYIIASIIPPLLQQAKLLFQKNTHTKYINFSLFPAYYPYLKTITHIFDMSDWLYTEKRKQEKNIQHIKKRIAQSSHIIVPNFFTGNEITELVPSAENKIEIIPYFPIGFVPPEMALFHRMDIKTPYFLYDGSYQSESNIEALIAGFAKYVHEAHSDYYLVLHGYSSSYIREISHAIEEHNIGGQIIVTGLLDIREQEALYKNASGWIDVSHYTTSHTRLALALSHRIPLLLSDIKSYEYYTDAVKIHPNNLIHLPEYFIKLAQVSTPAPVPEFFSDISDTMKKYHTILNQK